MSSSPLPVVLDLAAQLTRRHLASEVPGFEDAYGEVAAAIAANPRKGWPLRDGRWGYALANRGKPRVRLIYTFSESQIRVSHIQATPAEYLPPDRGP